MKSTNSLPHRLHEHFSWCPWSNLLTTTEWKPFPKKQKNRFCYNSILFHHPNPFFPKTTSTSTYMTFESHRQMTPHRHQQALPWTPRINHSVNHKQILLPSYLKVSFCLILSILTIYTRHSKQQTSTSFIQNITAFIIIVPECSLRTIWYKIQLQLIFIIIHDVYVKWIRHFLCFFFCLCSKGANRSIWLW